MSHASKDSDFNEYAACIAQAHKSCKEIVLLFAAIENDFTDMMATFHMQHGLWPASANG